MADRPPIPTEGLNGPRQGGQSNPKRDRAWAETALDEECKLIAAAPYGNRNVQLNASAYNIFQILWGNPSLLDEAEVRQRLFAAAEECDLVEDDGADACWRTIDSAAEAARTQPRTRPQLQLASARLDLSTASATFGAGVATPSSAQAASAPDPRRIVQLRDGFKSHALDEVEQALVRHGGFGIYQRGGQLVRTVLNHTRATDDRSTLVWRLEVVGTPHIYEVFSRIVEFQRYDRRSKAWVPTDCPAELPRMYEARRHWEVPSILGVVHTPQLRADGSLITAQGYDPSTRLLFKFDGEVFPAIPKQPTKDAALAALKLIEDEVGTFPFKTEVDRAVLLSLFLTVLCRRSFDVAPMHAITAPTPRTGKSLLIDLASILANGQSVSGIVLGKNDEEFRKTLSASLMAATPIIAIDNCERLLTGDLLNRVVTEERSEIRILGHSRNVLVESSSLITATGNNLMIGGDMSQRVLLCTLDARVERPEKRVFEGEPIKKRFRRRRGELVSALLTVLRAARLARTEIEQLHLPPLGGFEEWCAWVRDPLVWLGRANPVDSQESSYENNVDRETACTVLYAWRDCLGLGAKVRAQEIIDQANRIGLLGAHHSPLLREALMLVAEERGIPGNLSAKRLGWWLRKINGRSIDGLRIVKTKSPYGQPVWHLETC